LPPSEGPDQTNLRSVPRIAEPDVVAPAADDVEPDLVKASRKAMSSARADEERQFLVAPANRRCLTMVVTAEQVDRALGIWTAVISALAANKVAVRVTRRDSPSAHSAGPQRWPWTTKAQVGDHVLELAVVERFRGKRQAVPEERRRWAWSNGTEMVYIPTGELHFRVLGLEGTGARQKWTDSSRGKLEPQAPSIVRGVLLAGVALQRREAERRRREAEWERQRKLAAERAERDRQELQRRAHAIAMMRRWEAAERLRRFAEAAETAAANRDEDLSEWLAWARSYADAMDPLRAGDLLSNLVEHRPEQWFEREVAAFEGRQRLA